MLYHSITVQPSCLVALWSLLLLPRPHTPRKDGLTAALRTSLCRGL